MRAEKTSRKNHKNILTRIKNILADKMRSLSGESITETLVSVVMISLIFIILAGAITTSAGINAKMKNTDVTFKHGSLSSDGISMQVKLNGSTVFSGDGSNLDLYKADPEYYYFEVHR